MVKPMKRLLIVDDDEAIRKVCRTRLQDFYEIVDTGDPERALLIALQNKPDAILMDLSMPRLSGFELCRTLSAVSVTRRIPIFVVSGQDSRNKAFCQSLGAAAYFEKPIDFARLKNALSSALSPGNAGSSSDLQFQVLLKLRGRSTDGSPFEVRAATHSASPAGFVCASPASPREGSEVDVILCSGGGEHYLGRARALRLAEQPAGTFTIQFMDAQGEAAEKTLHHSVS
jgi:CheY-like chemotaxis protein